MRRRTFGTAGRPASTTISASPSASMICSGASGPWPGMGYLPRDDLPQDEKPAAHAVGAVLRYDAGGAGRHRRVDVRGYSADDVSPAGRFASAHGDAPRGLRERGRVTRPPF